MLKLVNGRWALVSKKTLRPLAYYKGEGKPSDEWVKKQEQRIQYFKEDIFGFRKSISHVVHSKQYDDALKKLKDLIDRKQKENKLRHDIGYYAQQITRSYANVDARKLASLYNEKYKRNVNEASYAGNIGVMEIFKFHQKATQEQKKKLQQHINNKKHKEAWDLIQHVSGVKLHPSVYESKNISPDILPVSGAGQDGTDTLVNNYKNATPGQGKKLKTFKQYNK
jgi:hypothetical protein